LHHFVAAGVWDAAPLETELLAQADKLVGGSDAVLVIDDTAMPKKGQHSVGVAAQYASALGKTANCQTLVSLTLARGEVPVTVALRLFLPQSWTNDPGSTCPVAENSIHRPSSTPHRRHLRTKRRSATALSISTKVCVLRPAFSASHLSMRRCSASCCVIRMGRCLLSGRGPSEELACGLAATSTPIGLATTPLR
jgi:hypothetical protein